MINTGIVRLAVMNEDRERFRSHLTAPQQKTDWSGLWWCIAIVIGSRRRQSSPCLEINLMRKKKEAPLASFIWCGAVVQVYTQDHHVCRGRLYSGICYRRT
ncbi:Uncharacterised protein [Raoultella terrigena]|uniref:Uncharacterized protein n=1 Tax=Raoultella terrigena TaxID=577 RepID=A0A4U9DE88_RAOTE|nr:Uncharacterised protein [Raoultella terrigena]